MNLLYKIVAIFEEEKDTLYLGELVFLSGYEEDQVIEVLITLVLVNSVIIQTGFATPRYFLNFNPSKKP